MSLAIAHTIAREGLATTSVATSVASRNIARADDPGAARKSTVVVGATFSGPGSASIVSAIDTALFDRAIESWSGQSERTAVAGALSRLGAVIGDPNAQASPAARIGALRSALQTATAAPHDEVALRGVLGAAQTVAASIRGMAQVVADVRREANDGLADGTHRLGQLLSAFGEANQAIVVGNQRRADVTDAIDTRNALIRDIAGLVDVRPAEREGGDMMLFLGNGATLFETSPRNIAFDRMAPLQAGAAGPALSIDGIPMGSADRRGGRLGGLLEVRDDIAINAGRQADEIARGLIVAFAEHDQSASPSQPALAGLFTYDGGPPLPPAGAVSSGLAASLEVNANADPSAGGAIARLRDGGIASPGDPAYVYNGAGADGFGDRLRELGEALSLAQAFDAAAGLATEPTGILEFATQSAGWIEGKRSESAGNLETATVESDRALGAWQGRVGVNVDDEMTTLIALQRSYQASSRLISAVEAMFSALLKATG